MKRRDRVDRRGEIVLTDAARSCRPKRRDRVDPTTVGRTSIREIVATVGRGILMTFTSDFTHNEVGTIGE